MQISEHVNLKVPVAMLSEARETWPEVREMSSGHVLRFALGYALTGDVNRAIAATHDPRIGTKRTPKTE